MLMVSHIRWSRVKGQTDVRDSQGIMLCSWVQGLTIVHNKCFTVNYSVCGVADFEILVEELNLG